MALTEYSIRTRMLIRTLFVFFITLLLNAVPGSMAAGATQAAKLSAKRIVTGNGIILIIKEVHSLPIVNVRVIIKAGAALDPEEKAGLAHLTVDLLDEGTATRTSAQIADEIDFLGASLSTGVNNDYATASLRILKKDFDAGLKLLSDILIRPSFAEAELERKRRETLGHLTADKDQPGVVADQAFDRIVFGNHPYHRPAKGLEQTLPAISREDIVQFYNEYFRPNNTILTFVGDVTEPEILALLDNYFGSWIRKPIPDSTFPPAAVLKKSVVELIDRELTQANIVMGHLGIERKSPDYYAVRVMNYILGGGGFSSRLLRHLRDNKGLAYSIYSHFTSRAFPGSFSVSLQTRGPEAQKAIDGVLSEIRKIRTTPVSNRELREAKSFLIGSFPLRIDTGSKMARLLSQMEFYELGLDYADRYPQWIRSVTKADVQKAAQKYLDPDRIALVVVANLKDTPIRKE